MINNLQALGQSVGRLVTCFFTYSSGEKLKKYVNTTNDPMTLQQRNDVQIKKCYHKHLVRY